MIQEHAVIQTDFQKVPQDLLEEILVECGRMPRADASHEVRVSRGILVDRLPEFEAGQVSKEMTRLGYGAISVPVRNLCLLDDPKMVRWIELNEEWLGIPEGIRGETIKVPWPSVLVVSSGYQAKDTRDKNRSLKKLSVNASGMIEMRTDFQEKFRRRSELVDVLDLVVVGPDGLLSLRLPSHQLAYERIMGRGTELTRFERYLELVEKVATRSADALMSPETKQLLVNRQRSRRALSGPSAHRILKESQDRYHRWLVYRAIQSGCGPS